MRRATLVALILAGMALAACSAAQPANYDPRDPRHRCPPGLFTGTDPGLRIELERQVEVPSTPARGPSSR